MPEVLAGSRSTTTGRFVSPARSTNPIPLDEPSAEALPAAMPRTIIAHRWTPWHTVFTGPEERAALNRLFDTFFQIPLYLAQQQKAAGKPPRSPRSRSSSGSRSPARRI